LIAHAHFRLPECVCFHLNRGLFGLQFHFFNIREALTRRLSNAVATAAAFAVTAEATHKANHRKKGDADSIEGTDACYVYKYKFYCEHICLWWLLRPPLLRFLLLLKLNTLYSAICSQFLSSIHPSHPPSLDTNRCPPVLFRRRTWDLASSSSKRRNRKENPTIVVIFIGILDSDSNNHTRR